MKVMVNRFEIRAKTFIDSVIKKSNKSYDELMVDLKNKIEAWSDEYRILSYINVFELNDIQHDRKHYLDELIWYGESLINKRKFYKNIKVTKCAYCGK